MSVFVVLCTNYDVDSYSPFDLSPFERIFFLSKNLSLTPSVGLSVCFCLSVSFFISFFLGGALTVLGEEAVTETKELQTLNHHF